ncbi:FecR family protein [Cyclobacterium salsum]|uniref:FecR family protein n=1 Tax=Cyclobacterium salsum TaxID=2666329 RepID=UPI00139081D1|nr:FecR domain-containing protein [Cyclobacterium salsum]
MKKKEFLNLLQKRGRGELNKIEEAKLLRILDLLQRRELDWEMDSREQEEIKDKMKAKIDSNLQSKPISRPSYYGMMKWAASFLVLIGLAYLGYQVQQLTPTVVWEERITNERQKAAITLPDGSIAFLNTNTRLRFPKEFVDGKREVELDGEAFFEVVKEEGATFEVNSQGVKTVVLGTAFNVRAHQESPVKVAVQSGKVAVFHQTSTFDTSGVELQPRQMATAIPGAEGFEIAEMDSDSFLDWKAGSVFFDMDPFDEVIQRLGSIYNYRIELVGEGMDQCQIKATYANGNLFAVLYGLKNLVAFDVENTGERALKITYKKCNL